MSSKTLTLLAAMTLAVSLWQAAEAATVKMRMVIVNPSPTKTQTKEIKSYLPKEVGVKDVIDDGGLAVDYDSEQSMLYVSKSVELAPSETKTFEIVLNDVWMVNEEKVKDLKDRTGKVLEKLADSPYAQQADMLGKTVLGRLDEIVRSQNDATVTRQQHIAHYRENLQILELVLNDIERLEKLLVTAGGPPNIDLIENTDANLKSPSVKTTWILIFIILIFLSILGGAFYFTWQGQAKVTENIFSREKDATYSDFKGAAVDDKKAP